MQTFISFHPKLSVSHVRVDCYGLFIELAHVLHLVCSDGCTDPKSWQSNASATGLMPLLRKSGLVSRKPGEDLRDALSPVSYLFTDFLPAPRT